MSVGTGAAAVPPGEDALLDALVTIQARGAIGERSLTRAIEHAGRFAPLLPPSRTVVDLGSGGGLPGLVVAVRRPDLQLTLVERRASRADLLRRAVSTLELGGRVEVLAVDVRDVARDGRTFDAVTARSFAAPLLFARLAAPLCPPGGLALVSEPPPAGAAGPPAPASREDRWPTTELSRAGWADLGVAEGIRRLRRLPT